MNSKPLRAELELLPPEAWDSMPAMAFINSLLLLEVPAEVPSPLTKRTLLVPSP